MRIKGRPGAKDLEKAIERGLRICLSTMCALRKLSLGGEFMGVCGGPGGAIEGYPRHHRLEKARGCLKIQMLYML